MIVEQKFDNCENHELHHSWKVFEIRQSWNESLLCKDNCSPSIETPIREEPSPFLRKETTHVRKCQNCLREELFEIEEVRKWVIK